MQGCYKITAFLVFHILDVKFDPRKICNLISENGTKKNFGDWAPEAFIKSELKHNQP